MNLFDSADQVYPAKPEMFTELEMKITQAQKWTPCERLVHLHELRKAYYGDSAANGEIEKIIRVIDTTTNEVVETIDFRLRFKS
jgi:hypothetical protein